MSIDIFEKYNLKLPTIEEADELDNPPVVAHFTNGDWDWYIVAGEKVNNDDYLLFGLVDGIYKEMGTFTLNQMKTASAIFNPDFETVGLYDLK